MNKQLQALGDDAGDVADDIRSLLAATANSAEEHIKAARKQLSESFGRSLEFAGRGARRADGLVRSHSYETAAIAFGLGALAALLITRCQDR